MFPQETSMNPSGLKHQISTLHIEIMKIFTFKYLRLKIMESQRAAMQYDLLQAQKNPACPCVSLTSHGKRFFSIILLIAQSVSMRLMLYVRYYTNWHIRTSGSTFTSPLKRLLLLPATLSSSEVFKASAQLKS